MKTLREPSKPVYYRIVGKTYCHEIDTKQAVFGRMRTKEPEEPDRIPFFSLGSEKILSRKHMQISWDTEGNECAWKLECLGKNGVTLTLLEETDEKGSYKTLSLKKGDSYKLTGPTPFRTTSADAPVRGWFQPVDPSKAAE
uniref:FHA domain-containing protein n=1 Tax=Lotharella oceanica TaxID=641309 RepID=A0A7S2TKH9_9EUKA|mmetsp:Transcript_16654/g.31581  ORF Transcript_16654/g.31581 Transcript_16654/m.31581 type:complete len:141 (+) Transcript_16654:36-458(+)|eukprot:CAMPEP_0170183534 /NCGR_PEP_ID=MMETSP0040_2-20121228/31024_1 /TAXON_ID=641309 /ORGANISM="Lotharella oceanica, Strain CCMP622" /LENGTH=140 /DNA_ID=CAMNT_0010429305 /DNA_START=19 /DNA_END=441 /DNA_ORIENTATION=-